MTKANKIYSLLGFAQKARKLLSGENTIETQINKRKISIIIIAENTSEKSKEKFVQMAKKYGIKYFIFGTKELIGQKIGQSPRAIIGIKRSEFARKISELLGEDQA